jgi:signal transduction histidine kinase
MPDLEETDPLVHLAGTVAHELNNIFTAVTGNLSLLESGGVQEGSNAGVISDVLRTANRGIELSQKLQAFAGRQKLNRTLFDLNRVVATVITGLKRSVLRNVDIDLALWPTACVVAADEEKFQHVLEELASNAAAAMNHRGWITVRTERATLSAREVGKLPEGPYVKLTLRDSGSGMSPDVMRRALDPLFSTRPGHQGWGLARCAGFLRQCGGDIVLTSTKGQGTAAAVYLPKRE